MQLVMRRYRLTGTYWNKFKINAQIALEDDEGSLIDKYLLKEAILITGNRWRDMKKAFWISGSISAIIALVYSTTRLSIMIPLSIFLSILLLLCIFGLLSFIVYQQIREEVRVIDLIVGRDFRARSLLDLLEKESNIRKMSDIFAQVVDQARTWHEPEVIDLRPQTLSEILGGIHAVS